MSWTYSPMITDNFHVGHLSQGISTSCTLPTTNQYVNHAPSTISVAALSAPLAAGAHAKPCAMHACAVQECTRPHAEGVQPKMYYRHGKACFSATCGKHQMSLLCGILTTNTVCHVAHDATLRPAFAGTPQMHTFNPISRQTSCSNSFSGC